MDESIEKVEAMKPVKLISVASTIEADMIMNFLESNGIQSIKKQEGSGSYMNLYYGFSVYGAEIYVDEQDLQDASELIKEINMDSFQSEQAIEEIDTNTTQILNSNGVNLGEPQLGAGIEDVNYKDYPFYRNPHILARIYLGVSIVVGLTVYLIGKFINS